MQKKPTSILCLLAMFVVLTSCGSPNAESSSGDLSPTPTSTTPPQTSTAGDPSLKNVVILGTGGTIAGQGAAGSTTGYTAGTLDIQSLIDGVPGLDKLANLTGEQILNVASDNVTAQDWLVIAKRINELSKGDVDGFVITHGTDTLEETAFFLHLTVKTEKPVIVVGAMRPATATSADGPMNLYQAVALARSDEAVGHGVMVVFSDGIYSARDVTKTNTFKTDAFGGRDFGCLGYMRDDTPFFYHQSLQPHTTKTPFDVTDLTELPKVGIAYFHIDADPALLEYMFKNYEGLILAGAGNGACSTLWSEKATEMMDKTGVPLIRTSRVANGIVGTGTNLTPQKARVLLQLCLTVTDDHAKIAEYFATY